MYVFLRFILLDLLQQNRVVATKKHLLRGWKLSFNINPFGIVHGWSSILHATIGKNNGRYGDRTPGIWFHGGSTKLHICSAINGNRNLCYNSKPLPRNRFSTILIQQIQKANHQYFFQIYINGRKVFDVLNKRPQVFANVKYYASDPWFNAARAIITKFRVINLGHRGKETLRFMFALFTKNPPYSY